MPDTVHCPTHGETAKTYVCSHLASGSYGLGFNTDEASTETPFPFAWCDNCEIIRASHNGWSDETNELVDIKLVCSGCYERTRIRNRRPSVTLDDLAALRWKCGTCEEWHSGPCLDFGYDAPHYWNSSWDKAHRWSTLPSGVLDCSAKTFLDEDYCAIDGEHFFVRGVLHLPIIGAAESLYWGIWGSLSRANFESLILADERGIRSEAAEMFSRFSTRLPDYPDTLNLKMWAAIQEPGDRPHFRLERTDHPLAKQYHEGIMPDEVRQIMVRMLPAQPD